MLDADWIGSGDLVKISEELFRISPRSSCADFLGRWLFDAMLEFNGAEFKVPEIP